MFAVFVCFFMPPRSLVFFVFFFLMIRRPPRSTPFPTRRSSDLLRVRLPVSRLAKWKTGIQMARRDRKSTRLNSSHQIISYAVFCLQKKKKNKPAFPHAKGRTARDHYEARQMRA